MGPLDAVLNSDRGPGWRPPPFDIQLVKYRKHKGNIRKGNIRDGKHKGRETNMPMILSMMRQRGKHFARMHGTAIFAPWCCRWIWMIVFDTVAMTMVVAIPHFGWA